MEKNVKSKLNNAFEAIKPNVMSLEHPSDQKGYYDFLTNEETQKRREEIRGEIERLGIQILPENYGSEIVVMQSLYENNGVPLYCIDSLKAKIIIEQRCDFIETLKELSTIDFNEIYEIFEQHIDTGQTSEPLLAFLKNMKKSYFLTSERETFQRDRLKDIQKDWQQHNGNAVMRLMYVGGIGHLADVEGVPTVYHLLKDDHDFEIHRHSLRQFDTNTHLVSQF